MIKKAKTKNELTKITFILPGDHTYGRVFLVGDFNNWDGSGHQFIKRSNNTYSVSIAVEPGREFEFRYLAEDGRWINEEFCDGYRTNEYGTENCLVRG